MAVRHTSLSAISHPGAEMCTFLKRNQLLQLCDESVMQNTFCVSLFNLLPQHVREIVLPLPNLIYWPLLATNAHRWTHKQAKHTPTPTTGQTATAERWGLTMWWVVIAARRGSNMYEIQRQRKAVFFSPRRTVHTCNQYAVCSQTPSSSSSNSFTQT